VQFYGLGAVAALLSGAQATLEATVSMASTETASPISMATMLM